MSSREEMCKIRFVETHERGHGYKYVCTPWSGALFVCPLVQFLWYRLFHCRCANTYSLSQLYFSQTGRSSHVFLITWTSQSPHKELTRSLAQSGSHRVWYLSIMSISYETDPLRPGTVCNRMPTRTHCKDADKVDLICSSRVACFLVLC